MSDIDNLTNLPYNYARERSLVVWRYCQENTLPYGTQPTSDDEADDARDVTPIAGPTEQPAEDWDAGAT